MVSVRLRRLHFLSLFVQELPLVNFILRKDPHEKLVSRLDKEYIRTSIHATMSVLKEFLSRKLAYDEVNDIQVLVRSSAKVVVLENAKTLGEVQAELWDPAEEDLILYYRIDRRRQKSTG